MNLLDVDQVFVEECAAAAEHGFTVTVAPVPLGWELRATKKGCSISIRIFREAATWPELALQLRRARREWGETYCATCGRTIGGCSCGAALCRECGADVTGHEDAGQCPHCGIA